MKRILIISSNRLGDTILSSGLNKFYKNKFQNTHVTLVCGSTPYDLFKYCNYIDDVICLIKEKKSIHWLKLWIKVVFIKWEEVVDLRGSLISYFLLTKKKTIIRKNKDKIMHKVEEITNFVSGKTLNPEIKVSRKNFINPFSEKKLIAVGPTANWSPKIWPPQNYLSLIKKLLKNKKFLDFNFVLLGPESEEDKIKLILSNNNKKIINMYGKLTLLEIFFFLKECKLYIGNDSGLMHLAALANIKTIGLFGPSSVQKYGPWGDKSCAISGNKSPDELMGHENFDSKKDDCLMGDLKIDFVYEKILEFYKE